VAAVVTGISLLAPFALARFSRALRKPFAALAPVPGMLAAASLPASLRRAAVATAALSTAIGMMVSVTVMIGSFRETVEAWVAQTVRSDLWLRPARSLSDAVSVFPESITEDLKRVPFIASFDRFRARDLVYGDSIITVGSGDFDIAANDGDLPMVTPRSAAEAIRDAIERRGVLVSESFSIKFDKGVGDTVVLPTPGAPSELAIHGVYRDYSNDRGVVVMDRPLFIEKFRDTTINTIAVFLKRGVDPQRARADLEARLGPRYGAFTTLNATIRTEVMRVFDQTFLITYGLLLVAIVVAVLGIVNTLSALILERNAEIALLRVLGMSRGEIRTMVLLESLIVAVVSTALGLATGSMLSYVLIFVVNKQSFGWTIQFDPPVVLVAASLAATFLTTVLAGLIPARFAEQAHLMKSE
ncbi:MAG TPA: FtsX-like permease family protein, partial [Thermoanaerobaculia bacterium]